MSLPIRHCSVARSAACVALATLLTAAPDASAVPAVFGLDALYINSPDDAIDGIRTNDFGPITSGAGGLGRYGSFFFGKTGTGGAGLTTNLRANTDVPVDNFLGDLFAGNGGPSDFEPQYAPLLDQSMYGALFDPDTHQLEVEYRPRTVGGNNINEAPFFNVVIEQFDGFIEDGSGVGNRSAEQIGYQIGGVDEGQMTLNDFYDANVGANGFATFTVPINTPTFNGKGFLFEFGDGTFRDLYVNESGDGADFDAVEGIVPLPNGAVQLNIQSAQGGDFVDELLQLEIKSVRVVPINPEPGLVARLDGRSGISLISGSPFANEADVTIPGDPNLFSPVRTDQFSRVSAAGEPRVLINTDDDNENGVVGAYQTPSVQTFDGTDAFVRLTARLTEELDGATQAESLTVTLKDLDGDDLAAGEGGEEYSANFDLTMFNTSTFTTVDIPLTDFGLTATANGFTNEGDGSLEDFNLYYLGMFVSAGSGLLDLEIDALEVRVPVPVLAGDYNDDGLVDAADYVAYRDALGQSITLPNETATPGEVTTEDLDAWRANYGATAGGTAAAVPEPASALMLLAAIGLGVARRRS